MDSVLDWGVEVILWLQSASPALDLPFIAITSLGAEEFLMLVMAFVFWCIDRRAGARLAALLLVSAWANAAAKELAAQPRPSDWDPRVRMVLEATGGGLPSGHTQSTVVLWGYLALTFRRRWLWVLGAVLVVLVPLSRLYLGVHFPSDLLGGAILGLLILGVFLRLEPPIETWLARLAWPAQCVAGVGVPLLLWLAHPAAGDGVANTLGTMMGAGLGLALERRLVRFEAGGPWRMRLLALALGLAVVLAVRLGLKAAFEGLEPEGTWRLVRYGAMGLWASLGAPWAFVRPGACGGARAGEIGTSSHGAV